MSTFHFKHFSVKQSDSAMKVGTDAMLLGALINSDDKKKGLDIGSGTGVLSLMIAQQNPHIEITAVEIDEQSAGECQYNFNQSEWADRLNVLCNDFLDLKTDDKFDLIFSNPPYYQTTNLNVDERKAQARHAQSLPVPEFLSKVKSLMTSEGSFWVIIPYEDFDYWKENANNVRLYSQSITNIIGKRDGLVKRVVVRFGEEEGIVETQTLTVREIDNSYTLEYIEYTKQFHGRPL
jgi:tRNA1Val (adenine37-N6)-methyltransferase